MTAASGQPSPRDCASADSLLAWLSCMSRDAVELESQTIDGLGLDLPIC
jgi:hypothetical protein